MRQKKILLVEDEQPIREMLRFALERENYHVLEAESALMAREVMTKVRPDLLLVDWMMPSESGIDFIKKCRHDEIFSDLPIIMLTAKVDEADMLRGLDGGADDYLTKTFAIKELMARINALLRRTSKANQDNKMLAGDIVLNIDSNVFAS